MQNQNKCVYLYQQKQITMKKIKNPFTNPIANNWEIYQGETDGNYYIITGYDKFLAVDEKQVFDDNGNVSYNFIYGERAKKNGRV